MIYKRFLDIDRFEKRNGTTNASIHLVHRTRLQNRTQIEIARKKKNLKKKRLSKASSESEEDSASSSSENGHTRKKKNLKRIRKSTREDPIEKSIEPIKESMEELKRTVNLLKSSSEAAAAGLMSIGRTGKLAFPSGLNSIEASEDPIKKSLNELKGLLISTGKLDCGNPVKKSIAVTSQGSSVRDSIKELKRLLVSQPKSGTTSQPSPPLNTHEAEVDAIGPAPQYPQHSYRGPPYHPGLHYPYDPMIRTNTQYNGFPLRQPQPYQQYPPRGSYRASQYRTPKCFACGLKGHRRPQCINPPLPDEEQRRLYDKTMDSGEYGGYPGPGVGEYEDRLEEPRAPHEYRDGPGQHRGSDGLGQHRDGLGQYRDKLEQYRDGPGQYCERPRPYRNGPEQYYDQQEQHRSGAAGRQYYDQPEQDRPGPANKAQAPPVLPPPPPPPQRPRPAAPEARTACAHLEPRIMTVSVIEELRLPGHSSSYDHVTYDESAMLGWGGGEMVE